MTGGQPARPDTRGLAGPIASAAPGQGAGPGLTDPSEEEDRAWVREFQQGREEGFNRLVLKHKDRVYTLCLRMLADRDEADDVAQETFVRVYRGLKDFRMESRFSTWVHRIAVNACKNCLESKAWRQRKAGTALEAAETTGAEASDALGELSSPTPAEELEAKGRRARIEAAIARLPEEQRVLVVLRDVEGRPYEEIAGSLGLNPGTMKSRLNRARAQLQDWLKELKDG